jgi:hypothetical protein
MVMQISILNSLISNDFRDLHMDVNDKVSDDDNNTNI